MSQEKIFNLTKKNQRIYTVLNALIFFSFFILAIILVVKIIFPSQFFTYSFANINSQKNTISDVYRNDDILSFYASTPLTFSQVELELELAQTDSNLTNKEIAVRKSYKSMFYPQGESLDNLNNKKENQLVSIDNSVFIIGTNQKTPIDSVLTFESLGYRWENVAPNTLDLSNHEKQKLFDINAAHPNGTILKANPESQYYFIEDFTKKLILNPADNQIKNAVDVDTASLSIAKYCSLKKSTNPFKKAYHCQLPVTELDLLTGKDYQFSLKDLPANLNIKRINLEFKKSITLSNFNFFLSDLKNKILYRFGIKNEAS
ncbi:MAG: hypothetical protein WAV16_04625 [Candidatus Moraniibacteriota bacterium]